MKFPEINKLDVFILFFKLQTIERRYLGKVSKKALSFMKAIFKMDPKDRVSVDQALAHPYMEGLS